MSNKFSLVAELEVKKFNAFLIKLEKKLKIPNAIWSLAELKVLSLRTEKLLTVFARLESQLTLKAQLDMRKDFRSKLGRFFYKSKLLKRFYEKPQGYPGDYLMFEDMYAGTLASSGLGLLYDRYVLKHPLIKSVINRKNLMKSLIKKFISKNQGECLSILNIACGPSREVRELLEEVNVLKSVSFFFVDQDKDALKFTRRHLGLRNDNVAFHYFESNIIKILHGEVSLKRKFNLIYSLGLLDYFRDNVLVLFFESSLNYLEDDGTIIVALCSKNNLKSYCALRWLCDWSFYLRDHQETLRLLRKHFSQLRFSVEWEQGNQIFFIIAKRINQ